MQRPEKILRLLHIEESACVSEEICQHLKEFDYEIELHRISRRSELEDSLSRKHWHLIISDFFVPDLSAFDVLEIVAEKKLDLPFILVSGGIGEECVAELMNAGVEDFVLKNRLERLGPVVRRIIREHETKTLEVQSRLLVQEALAAKEQMLAIVSHDIKNPLSAIKLDAQMLQRNANKQESSQFVEDVKHQIGRIIKTTDRLKDLIGDLLDKNKTESSLASLLRADEDLFLLITEVVDSLRPLMIQKEIVLNTHFSESLKRCYCDKNKMFQVISNLLTNAIKFTPEKGSIEIHVTESDQKFQFTIKDSGPGFKNQDIERVFNKYWTADVSGTGLGLYICKSIVEAHGGMIKGENRPDGGALFWFSLPKNANIDVKHDDERKRIIVVDDDEDLRDVISWVLSREGYAVRSYRNPVDALDGLHSGNSPHLIVTDFHMDGMRGEEFLKIKDSLPKDEIKNCPVLIISATPDEVHKEVPTKYYQEVIPKPLDLEGMVGHIKKYLN